MHPCTDILDYVVPLDWTRVVIDADSVSAALHGARTKSAPGPDGLSYKHLLHFEAEVVHLLLNAHTHTQCARDGAWHPCFQEAAHVFIPKIAAPTVACTDLRPLALKNAIGKLIPAVYSHQLAEQCCVDLADCQFGGLPGRTISDVFLALEKIALYLAQHFPEASILSVDLKTAFPSIRRSWCLSVLRASGADYCAMNFFANLLGGNPINLHPLETSGVARLSCGHWAAAGYISWRLPGPIALRAWKLFSFIAYFDDGTVLTAYVWELRLWEHAFAVLEEVLGLRLNPRKSKLIPIGVLGLQEFRERFTSFSLLAEVQVVDHCRWLGVWIGRDKFQPHTFMVERMAQRLVKVQEMQGGSAIGSVVGNAVLLSIPRHTLRMFGPDGQLEEVWKQCCSAMVPGWKQFLGASLPRLRDLFGMPASIPLALQVALEAQLAQIVKLKFDPRTPLDTATRLGIMKLRRVNGEVLFVNTRPWVQMKRAILDYSTVTQEQTLCFFRARLHKNLEAENVDRQFYRDKFLLQIREACKRLAKRGPAMAFSLLRILFIGFRTPSVHCHDGNCCLCHTLHTGTLLAPV
eukprot:5916451-Amphidinium_carterae.4